MVKSNSYINVKMVIGTVLCVAIVLSLTHIPQDSLPWRANSASVQACQHVLAYGLITFFTVVAIQRPRSLRLLALVLLILACIGAVDELTQSYVGRQATLVDFGSDMVGIIATLCISWVWDSNRKHRILGIQTPGPQ